MILPDSLTNTFRFRTSSVHFMVVSGKGIYVIPKQDSWVAKEEDVSCEKKESELLNVHEKMISERKQHVMYKLFYIFLWLMGCIVICMLY